MPSVWTIPVLSAAERAWRDGFGGGPVHHQIGKAKYLRKLGWHTVDDVRGADLIHGHGVIPATCDALTIHAIWPVDYCPEHPAFWDEHNAIMRDAMTRARAVVALSAFTANRCRWLAPEADVRAIPQAFDPEEWQGVEAGDWRLRRAIPKRSPVLLWAKTGVSELCAPGPFVALLRELPEVHGFLCADRREIEAVTGWLPTNAHPIGPQPAAAYRSLVAACDVFVATTLESSGQAHLEAMYLGKPVLGYDWGGVAETVGSDAGVLVAPGHVGRLAHALEQILRQRKRLARGAQASAERFTWQRIAPQYVALYEQLMKEKA